MEMEKGEYNKMTNSTNNKKTTRTYEEIKESIINKSLEIVKRTKEIRLDLIDAIHALRAEKKDKKRVVEQLKNDFFLTGYVRKTMFHDVIKEVYEPELWQKTKEQEEEKKKILVAAGGQQEMSEGGNDSEEDRDSIREKAKKNLLSKSIGGTERKLRKTEAATVTGLQELQNAPDDENDFEDDSQESNSVTYTQEESAPSYHNVVIDNWEHIEKIKKIIANGDAIVIVVNNNNEPEEIESGIKLAAPSKAAKSVTT